MRHTPVSSRFGSVAGGGDPLGRWALERDLRSRCVEVASLEQLANAVRIDIFDAGIG